MSWFLQQRYRHVTPGKYTETLHLNTGLCTIPLFHRKIESPIQDYCTQHNYIFKTIIHSSPYSKESDTREVTFTYDIPDEIEN